MDAKRIIDWLNSPEVKTSRGTPSWELCAAMSDALELHESGERLGDALAEFVMLEAIHHCQTNDDELDQIDGVVAAIAEAVDELAGVGMMLRKLREKVVSDIRKGDHDNPS